MSVADDEIQGIILEEPVFNKKFSEVLVELDEDGVETAVEGSFTWHIDRWSELKKDKYISPKFKIGDFWWNLLLFPQGNHNRSLAVYLEPHFDGASEPKEVDEGDCEKISEAEESCNKLDDTNWYCCAQFAVVLSKPGMDEEISIVNRSHHRFNANDTDWGFANLIDLYSLKNQVKGRLSGFINDDAVNFTVYVRILNDLTGVLWHNFINYDSKQVTGYVGFRNQGATCYLNSLLQSYFFTKYFRKLVYEIPTENENPNDSVPLALQRAFYQLQVSKFPLDTLELTRSFGWDTADAFQQHDVQELNRILMDRLETKMKGTSADGKLSKVFVGKMKSYIKCKNVDYESSRIEDFWDIQLNVKNMKDLTESFQNYIEVELMDGENQYAAPEFGLQDAFKGVVFESFPKVLHLQLKRFEYDFNFDQLIKVNDRYEFPESIDLSPYMDENIDSNNYGSSSHDAVSISSKKTYNYKLHGVLVHTGDISTGHYYTMIKPTLKDQWYRFDDEKVWKITKKQVFDENFGLDRLPDNKLRGMTREEYQNYIITRHTNAYMLVYIAEDYEEEVLQSVTEEDVPEHVVVSIKKENEERDKREREIKEAHLYVNINVHSIKNFINYQGFDISPNEDSNLYDSTLYDENSKSISMRVLRTTYLKDLYKEINEKLSIPHGKNVRYWKMDYRKNGTLRLEAPIKSDLDAMTLQEATNYKEEEILPSMDIFVEEPYLEMSFLENLKQKKLIESAILTNSLIDDLRTNLSKLDLNDEQPVIKDIENHNIIFVKNFDPASQKLLGFGHIVMKNEDYVSTITETINKIRNDSSDIQLVEELNPGDVYQINLSKQIFAAELTDGDIVTFESPNSTSPETIPTYGNVTEFYHFLRHRVKLAFTKAKESTEDYVLENSSPEKFEFWVSTKITYNDLSTAVGNYAKVDPNYLKIFAVYPNATYTLKSESVLKDYLIRDYNCDLIPPFEYEVLSLPLKELEHLRSVKLYWLTENYLHYQVYEFKIPKTFTVGEFLDKVQKKLGFSDDSKKNILLWTNYNFQFDTVLFEDNTFDDIGKSLLLFGRILPEETKLLKQLDQQERFKNNQSSFLLSSRKSNESLSTVSDVPKGRLVIVMQYFKDLDNKHGISFLFDLIPGETLAESKVRLHSRFGLGQKEFSKIKLSLLMKANGNRSLKSLHNCTEEEENKIILFDIMSHLDYIFMDHPDRLRSQASQDKPMMIK